MRWKARTNFRAALQPLHVFCDVPGSTHNNKLFKKSKHKQSQNPHRKAQTIVAETVTGFWPMLLSHRSFQCIRQGRRWHHQTECSRGKRNKQHTLRTTQPRRSDPVCASLPDRDLKGGLVVPGACVPRGLCPPSCTSRKHSLRKDPGKGAGCSF